MNFDPYSDYPPDGVTVVLAGQTITFHDDGPYWRVEEGTLTGAIAWPFSEQGMAVARHWAAVERAAQQASCDGTP